jgi:hypothetical protein
MLKKKGQPLAALFCFVRLLWCYNAAKAATNGVSG